MKQTILIVFVILFLCDKLFAEKPSILTEGPFIILASATNETHKKLNMKFLNMAKKLGFEIIESEIENQNLYHRDLQNKDSSTITINLSVTDTEYCNICNSANDMNIICFSEIIMECPLNNTKPLAITTDSILEYGILYNAIANNNFEVLNNVLVCLPNNLPETDNIQGELKELNPNLAVLFQYNCETLKDINSSLLAIVTPSPYDLETNTPTIIYNTPHLYPEAKDQLPNMANLMIPWKHLKYAILQFLKSMNWYRVAVLSDDAEDSVEFLEDLTPFLDENDITYSSEICNCIGRNCDFIGANKRLTDMKIVILNLNSKNGRQFLNYMTFLDKNRKTKIKWIVRGWPFDKDEKFHSMVDLFSFTQSSVFGVAPSYNDLHSPYVSVIRRSLELITTSYKDALGDREKFTKWFASKTKDSAPYKTIVYIIRKFHEQDLRVVATMEIENTKVVKELKFAKIYDKLPLDVPRECFLRSRNYFQPCDDELLLILLGVLILFMLVYLIVTLYFVKCHNNLYSRLF
ncbi:unnamed protein product [Chilo suppressalis]|uniref:Receptor ligand binding region domain-containing protein n=1 Tax=Chilo suppressalis TaxID=168631 RepID=A0ABN8AWQ9_CHISP|nr:hypothetical protein evm_005665 [Chilo suppressalis]CAH0397168.1 unnamed protein product [Chilo suppressalis]